MRFLILALSVASLYGEVTDSAANGFTIQQSWTVQATPEAVYAWFMDHVRDWWSPAHTFSRDAHNLSIQARPGGCWCEKLPKSGGFVRHLELVYLEPSRLVRFAGGLGPLQAMAVNGAMTIRFDAAEGATKVQLTYTVGGYMDKGLNTLAPVVDMVLKEQFGRFKSFVETGSPTDKKN